MDESYRRYFLVLGTQYYAAGRIALAAGLSPVHTNLLHHAVELYLKAVLVGSVPVERLRRDSHRLDQLWARLGRPASPLDRVIADLNRCEDLRYPDALVRNPETRVVMAWSRPPSERTTMPTYSIVMHDIDELIALLRATPPLDVVDVLGRDFDVELRNELGVHMVPPISDDALAAIRAENPHAALWQRG